MSSDRSNATASTPNQRFCDVQYEPTKLLLPIRGYWNVPLVPLEEAIAPVKHLLEEDIDTKVYIAIQNCQRPKDDFTPDESAALQLYTMESENSSESLYFVLNQTLRSEERRKLTPWFCYLKLLLTGLCKLPNQRKTIYRGVNGDLRQKYNEGDNVVWWGFNSCTESLRVLENEQFLCKSGTRTIFNIECCNGKRISNHSFYQGEEEILLLPATQLVVVGKLSAAPGLHIIQLRELDNPPFQLLKSPLSQSVNMRGAIGRIEVGPNFIDRTEERLSNEMPTQMLYETGNPISQMRSNLYGHAFIYNNNLYTLNSSNAKVVSNGNNNILRKSYHMGSFDSIILEGGFNVELTHSSKNQTAVEIETHKHLHDSKSIHVSVTDKALRIRVANCSYSVMNVFIELFTLRYLSVYGSGEVKCMNTLMSANESSEIICHGSVNANLRISANNLHVQLHGSGSVHLEGSVQHELRLACHGSGLFDNAKCVANVVRADIHGSAVGYIAGRTHIDLRAGGSSQVFYRGPLRLCNTSGSCSVRSF